MNKKALDKLNYAGRKKNKKAQSCIYYNRNNKYQRKYSND